MTEQRTIRIEEIKVGKRFRQEYGDIDRLAESFKRLGVISPLSVDAGLNLIAGGRRYAAATLAGLQEVPVQIFTELDDISRREIELEENIERKDLTWQEEISLKSEIDKLKKSRFGDYKDDRLSGWSAAKTAQLLGESTANISRDLELAKAIEFFPELSKERTKQDASRKLKELKEAVVLKELERRVGDKAPQQWRWAPDCYIVGDALAGMERMKAGTAHLIECDPPYGVEIDSILRSADVENLDNFQEVAPTDFPVFMERLAQLLYRIAHPNAYLIIWFGAVHQHTVYQTLTDAGWRVDPIPAIWVKNTVGKPADTNTRLMVRYETFYVARKGDAVLAKATSNVFIHDSVPTHQRISITEKPVALYDELLNTFFQPGMRVVCPFLGSGNFMLSCYKRNITCYGWDLSESNKERFIRRVQREFGYEPTRPEVPTT